VKPFDLDIDAMLKRLTREHAPNVARSRRPRWDRAVELSRLLVDGHRGRNRAAPADTRTAQAQRSCLPFLKTVDDFNFTHQSTVKLALLGSALSPDFVTDGRNLIFHGKPEHGKTRLAVAIGYRAHCSSRTTCIKHLNSSRRSPRVSDNRRSGPRSTRAARTCSPATMPAPITTSTGSRRRQGYRVFLGRRGTTSHQPDYVEASRALRWTESARSDDGSSLPLDSPAMNTGSGSKRGGRVVPNRWPRAACGRE
jgi:hypothetical protein